MGKATKQCLRCGFDIQSYSPMRKWCFDCRKVVSLEQARDRKLEGISEE